MVADEKTVELLAEMNIDLNITTLTDLAEQMECHDYPTAARIARSGAHALLTCQTEIDRLSGEIRDLKARCVADE